MLLRSFAVSGAALLAIAPSALASFNSTLISSPFGVKLVEDTPPSITSTFFFFNLFGPLERTEDFPADSDDCVGHEACIIRTITCTGSKPLTVDVIPLGEGDTEHSNFSAVYYESSLHNRSVEAYVIFLCKDQGADNSMKSEISPIDTYPFRGVQPNQIGCPQQNLFSNFRGVYSFDFYHCSQSFLFIDSYIPCADMRLSLHQGESGFFSRLHAKFVFLSKLVLLASLIAILKSFKGRVYVKTTKCLADLDHLSSIQAITETRD
ncbi:uncharacterized protein V1516DRAFT_713063 [Lipomyces oligophaga]|uniref:uncharacterized protein n=1 Tax=Lipomyces oligophaga TaxID=45792 RepID=UPI0034CE36F3